MKRKIASKFCSFFLAGLFLAVASASAQTIAYRQMNLASDVNAQGFANQLNLSMNNSWGISFLPGQPFFIVNPGNGRVTVHDANGAGVAPLGFAVPSPVAGHDSPIGPRRVLNTALALRGPGTTTETTGARNNAGIVNV